jgi:hypothetical protein
MAEQKYLTVLIEQFRQSEGYRRLQERMAEKLTSMEANIFERSADFEVARIRFHLRQGAAEMMTLVRSFFEDITKESQT